MITTIWDFLVRVWGAVTLTTVITAVMAALSLWICWIEREEKSTVWMIGLISGILGIAAIGSSIADEMSSQAEIARIEGRIEGVDEKAGSAIGAAEGVRSDATRRDFAVRKLDFGPLDGKHPGTRVFLIFSPGSKESKWVADELQLQFARIGWDVVSIKESDEYLLDGITTSTPPSELSEGEGTGYNAAFALAKLLEGSGLKAQWMFTGSPLGERDIEVLVGPSEKLKPPNIEHIGGHRLEDNVLFIEGKRVRPKFLPTPKDDADKEKTRDDKK